MKVRSISEAIAYVRGVGAAIRAEDARRLRDLGLSDAEIAIALEPVDQSIEENANRAEATLRAAFAGDFSGWKEPQALEAMPPQGSA